MKPSVFAALILVGALHCQGADKATKPIIVAVDTNKLEYLPYDAGRMKFIASSEQTNGRYAVMELVEMPGYKTAWHRHPDADESFYVLEGTLTIKLVDKVYQLPAGSYVLIPRQTTHGQGNFTSSPLRLICTFTPGGFDHFFRDRIELDKTVKRGDPQFQKRFDELRAKHRNHVEILGEWTP
jgi:quercetin dioxygenase-like cupin family protein